MRNSEQTLRTAIGELKCLSADRPASLDELTALRAARDCVDELLNACVAELRSDPQRGQTWPAIAYALGYSSASAAQQNYGSRTVDVTTDADQQVSAFWQAHSDRFTWNFLPTGFLYALYVQWLTTGTEPLPQKAFTRRLKTAATASGHWRYTRSRVGALIATAEPLAAGMPRWSRIRSGGTLYGLRRSTDLQVSSRAFRVERGE